MTNDEQQKLINKLHVKISKLNYLIGHFHAFVMTCPLNETQCEAYNKFYKRIEEVIYGVKNNE